MMTGARYVLLGAIALSLIAVAGAFLVRYLGYTGPLCDGCNIVLVSLDAVNGEKAFPADGESILPFLEARAKMEGVVFRSAYSPATQGWLGNVALLTGKYPWDMSLWEPSSGIPRDVPTLAETLASYGYDTAGFARGLFVDEAWGFSRGFSTWEHVSFPENSRVDALVAATEWLSSRERATPFFLFVQPVNLYSWFADAGLGFTYENALAAHAGDTKALDALRRGYKEKTRLLDEELEGFLEFIATYDNGRPTVVVVTGSYGDEFLDRPEGGFGEGLLPREKTLHVPLVFFIPGTPASFVDATVESRRVADTIKQVVGARSPVRAKDTLVPFLEGDGGAEQTALAYVIASRTPTMLGSVSEFRNGAGRINPEAVIIPETSEEVSAPSLHKVRSLIAGKWHLLYADSGERTLYELWSDPDELRNVLGAAKNLGWLEQRRIGELFSELLKMK